MLEFGKVSGALSAVLIRRSQVLHYASRWGHHTRGISQGARLHLAALFWVTVLVAAVYALANIGERKRVSQAGIRTTLWPQSHWHCLALLHLLLWYGLLGIFIELRTPSCKAISAIKCYKLFEEV